MRWGIAVIALVVSAGAVDAREAAGPPTCTDKAPAGAAAPDTRLTGGWAMIVPGGAWTTENDRGSYIERIQQVAVGAPAGALTISADRTYEWRKRASTERGALGWCVSTRGESGWSVKFGRENFFVRFVEGRNGGFYLFSTFTGFPVYQGKPVK